MFKKDSETKLRFSIRKLSLGAASVLIGITIFGFSSKPVAADQTSSASEQNEIATISDKQNKTEAASDKTQALHLETSKNQASLNAAEIKESKAESNTNTSEKALVSNASNTTSSTPKVNGNSTITNVPADGSITYDYSVDVNNKTTGEEESVHSGASGQDNRAALNPDNASEINAHLILANTSDQDKVIGNTDYDDNPDHYNPARHNDDEATLYINAWSGANRSLKIDGSKAATVTLTKNGQVIANNSRLPLTVYYLASDGHWYTYDEMVTNFGQAAIKNVTQIGFKGILASGVTADMSVPLVYDATASRTDNQISIKALDAKSIYVTAEKEPAKVWTDDEIKDDYIHPMVRNDDGSYSEVAEEADLIKLLPKAGGSH